jgi:heme-degrading monooxygenase HmoA
MISRQWRGVARPDSAHAYVEHLRSETFPALRSLRGFVGASILRRELPEGVEFLVVTQWDSLDAIRAFAGADVEAAVVPAKVRDMMVEHDATVRHYEVVT